MTHTAHCPQADWYIGPEEVEITCQGCAAEMSPADAEQVLNHLAGIRPEAVREMRSTLARVLLDVAETGYTQVSTIVRASAALKAVARPSNRGNIDAKGEMTMIGSVDAIQYQGETARRIVRQYAPTWDKMEDLDYPIADIPRSVLYRMASDCYRALAATPLCEICGGGLIINRRRMEDGSEITACEKCREGGQEVGQEISASATLKAVEE